MEKQAYDHLNKQKMHVKIIVLLFIIKPHSRIKELLQPDRGHLPTICG